MLTISLGVELEKYRFHAGVAAKGDPNVLWFAAADVLKVIELTPAPKFERFYNDAEYRQLEDENFAAFSEVGVKKLLMSSTHIESKRMMLWIEREVIKPQRRRLELNRVRRAD